MERSLQRGTPPAPVRRAFEPGSPLAVRIAGLVHFGVDDQLAGISLWVMGVFAGLGGSVLWLMRRVES